MLYRFILLIINVYSLQYNVMYGINGLINFIGLFFFRLYAYLIHYTLIKNKINTYLILNDSNLLLLLLSVYKIFSLLYAIKIVFQINFNNTRKPYRY